MIKSASRGGGKCVCTGLLYSMVLIDISNLSGGASFEKIHWEHAIFAHLFQLCTPFAAYE